MEIRESEEMYLETILLLKMQKSVVRSVDIVDKLDYAKSSVSRGVNLLKERGYITFGDNGEITLTESGQKRAEEVFERHRVITAAFVKMGAPRETAEDNACRIEHVITQDLFEIIKKFVNG